MGTAERKEREKIQRRNDIVDAAERVFFAKGFQQATMDDVAEEAELSKGTLYLYFKSKDELYLSIHLRSEEFLANLFAEVMQADEPGLKLVKALGEAYFRFAFEHRNYFEALMAYEVHKLNPGADSDTLHACQQKGIETLNYIIHAIQQGIDDGSIRADIVPPELAIQLWATSTGLVQMYHNKREELAVFDQVDMDRVVSGYFDLIFHAISSKKSGEQCGTV